jgi:membrane protease subunit (stomatin/prohibitin family)
MGVGVLGGMGAGGMGGTPAAAAFDVIKSQQVANAASTPIAAAAATSGWKCECGHEGNAGKFCAECGKPMPKASQGWDCVCGAKANTGKFCAECGKKKETEVATVAECKACGWKGTEGQAAPKFCPECGQAIK